MLDVSFDWCRFNTSPTRSSSAMVGSFRLGLRARLGPVQTSKLRAWLVGRTHTLENVGRNEWLYIKQTEVYNRLLTLIKHVLQFEVQL